MAILQVRSIGNKLKQIRLSRGLSLAEIAVNTKIKKDFLVFIENDEFEKIGSHVYVKGFIKNYAKYLNVDFENLIALYRRDYENKTIKRQIKKDTVANPQKKSKLQNIYITSRHLSFIFITFVIAISTIGIFTLVKTTFKNPYLEITEPFQIKGEYSGTKMLEDKSIFISGKTTEGVLVRINEEPVKLNPDYSFRSEPVQIASEDSKVIIEAKNQIGRKTKIELKIDKPESLSTKTEFSGLESIITVKGIDSYILIRSDGVIKFNDKVFSGDAIAINAESSIELETSNPETFNININGVDYNLDKIRERFELSNGQVLRVN